MVQRLVKIFLASVIHRYQPNTNKSFFLLWQTWYCGLNHTEPYCWVILSYFFCRFKWGNRLKELLGQSLSCMKASEVALSSQALLSQLYISSSFFPLIICHAELWLKMRPDLSGLQDFRTTSVQILRTSKVSWWCLFLKPVTYREIKAIRHAEWSSLCQVSYRGGQEAWVVVWVFKEHSSPSYTSKTNKQLIWDVKLSSTVQTHLLFLGKPNQPKFPFFCYYFIPCTLSKTD